MKIYSLDCPACGYKSKHPVGTPDMDQILTDVNTEFAQYKLFVCRKEEKLVHIDVLDAHFEGKCPSDGGELQEVVPQQAKCPRCGKDLNVLEIKPLATAESSAE